MCITIIQTKLYSKTCLKRPLKKKNKNWFSCLKTNYRLMQVKSIAECSKREHSAILLTFIMLQLVIKIFVFSIFEWLLKTGLLYIFTVKLKYLIGFTCIFFQNRYCHNFMSFLHLNNVTYLRYIKSFKTQLKSCEA